MHNAAVNLVLAFCADAIDGEIHLMRIKILSPNEIANSLLIYFWNR